MKRWLKVSGIVIQGLILGTLLFFAVIQIITMASGARIFRYQGF